MRELNPAPTTELAYATPFELLIAVILSAQATDVGVNKATRRLYPLANTPQAILALGEEGLKKHIATLGLFNAKAKNVIATCAILVDQHGGEVPHERAALEALPGVGRKTANVVLNTAFGEPTMAVDTHIFRVANRTGLAPGKDVRAVEDGLLRRVPAEREALEALPGVGRKTANVVLNTVFRQPAMAVDTHIFRLSNRTGLAPGKDVLEVEKALLRRVPKDYLLDAHHWLILHGRYVCTARKPRCGECAVRDLCLFRDKTD